MNDYYNLHHMWYPLKFMENKESSSIRIEYSFNLSVTLNLCFCRFKATRSPSDLKL